MLNQIDRLGYGFQDAKAKRWWDGGTSSEVSWFKHDPRWEPRFVAQHFNTVLCPKDAEKRWRIYEFQRTQFRPELPRITVRKLIPRVHVEDAGWLRVSLDPMFVMIQKMRAKHGSVMADALTKLDPKTPPIYSIKRTGRTKKFVKEVLPDTIRHHGMFMFFWDDHDIVMAKIGLGSNIAYEYDLRQFAC